MSCDHDSAKAYSEEEYVSKASDDSAEEINLVEDVKIEKIIDAIIGSVKTP